MSVYLTVVFSIMMKGLLIVLSVSVRPLSVCPQIVRQKALLKHYEGRQRAYLVCSTRHNATHSQRETQNKQIIFFI